MRFRGARAVAVTGAFLAGAGGAVGAGAQATIGGEWRADVERAARRLVDAKLTPGIGVAVSVNDWVAYADGFGAADASTGRGVTGDTPFYIASTTKSLTALAAVLAAHERKLDLGAPMVRYLPRARLPEGVPREAITVHDLAALTHGLAGSGPVVLRTAYTGQFTTEQLLDLLRHHEPTGNKGTFNYNNLGFNLLGLVLESVYGTSWKEVVERLVIGPIGMTSTTAKVSEIPPDRIALPHAYTPDGFIVGPAEKQDANMHAAGGHFASARDLARYTAVHASGGMLDGRRVLPEAAVRATHVVRAAQNRRFGPFTRQGWGYGWDVGMYDGDTLLARFGGFEGYRSHMSFMPVHGIGVAVLVNGSGPASVAADVLATYIYDRLMGRSDAGARLTARIDTLTRQTAQASQGMAEHLAERRARLAPLGHPLGAFAGAYESPVLGRMEWRVVAGGLEMRMGVVHSRAEVFDASKNQLRIEVGGSGQVATFSFPAGGGPASSVTLAGEEFRRVPAAAMR